MSRLVEEIETEDREFERELKGEQQDVPTYHRQSTQKGQQHAYRPTRPLCATSKPRTIRWGDQVGRPIESQLCPTGN